MKFLVLVAAVCIAVVSARSLVDPNCITSKLKKPEGDDGLYKPEQVVEVRVEGDDGSYKPEKVVEVRVAGDDGSYKPEKVVEVRVEGDDGSYKPKQAVEVRVAGDDGLWKPERDNVLVKSFDDGFYKPEPEAPLFIYNQKLTSEDPCVLCAEQQKGPLVVESPVVVAEKPYYFAEEPTFVQEEPCLDDLKLRAPIIVADTANVVKTVETLPSSFSYETVSVAQPTVVQKFEEPCLDEVKVPAPFVVAQAPNVVRTVETLPSSFSYETASVAQPTVVQKFEEPCLDEVKVPAPFVVAQAPNVVRTVETLPSSVSYETVSVAQPTVVQKFEEPCLDEVAKVRVEAPVVIHKTPAVQAFVQNAPRLFENLQARVEIPRLTEAAAVQAFVRSEPSVVVPQPFSYQVVQEPTFIERKVEPCVEEETRIRAVVPVVQNVVKTETIVPPVQNIVRNAPRFVQTVPQYYTQQQFIPTVAIRSEEPCDEKKTRTEEVIRPLLQNNGRDKTTAPPPNLFLHDPLFRNEVVAPAFQTVVRSENFVSDPSVKNVQVVNGAFLKEPCDPVLEASYVIRK